MKSTFPSQLQDRFEQAILAGQYAKGQIVSAEFLAEQFQAPPDQMRLVLAATYRKGLIQSRVDGYEIRGMSTAAFDSIFQHTSKSGLKPSSCVRAVTIEPANAEVAARLDLTAGDPVYRLVRTRIVDDLVVANQVNHIPFELCPGLENHDLSHRSFQKLMEEQFHVVFADRVESIEIAPATPNDATILGLSEGDSILVLQRILFGITQQPVVWADIRIRADRYHFLGDLWPAAAPLAAQIASR